MAIRYRIKKILIQESPNGALEVAKLKRELEKKLRADGWSRWAAMAEVSRVFVNEK